VRRRVEFPLRPFDLTPPYLVDAAKRIFTVLWYETRTRVPDELAWGEPVYSRRPHLVAVAETAVGDIATKAR
jgi:hypothetical protein